MYGDAGKQLIVNGINVREGSGQPVYKCKLDSRKTWTWFMRLLTGICFAVKCMRRLRLKRRRRLVWLISWCRLTRVRLENKNMIVDMWCRVSGFWWRKKDSRKGFITAVEDQIEPTLLSIIKKCIEPGTIVVLYCWKRLWTWLWTLISWCFWTSMGKSEKEPTVKSVDQQLTKSKLTLKIVWNWRPEVTLIWCQILLFINSH